MSSKRQRSVFAAPTVKMVLLGLEGVGKSALMVRFLTRRFIGDYAPNLESTHRRNIGIGNSTLIVDMKDTAGQNDLFKLEKDFLWADVFILVYSITSEKSFEEIQTIHKSIELSRTTTNTIFVIVGTKKDLEHLREVPKDIGRELADKYSCPFYEVSVSEGYHETNKIFNEIIKYILYTKSNEESTNIKKRNYSFTTLWKVYEKQNKCSRESKEKRLTEIIEVRDSHSL